MIEIGKGIFMWDRDERVSNRYGAFYFDASNYAGDVRRHPVLIVSRVRAMEGKRVRLVAEVIESRKSGHCGDMFLKVFPTQPEVGERVELGVGRLHLVKSYDGDDAIELRPEDGRKEFWIDPRRLYRLHDQTVMVYAEETEDACHDAPVFAQVEADGAIGADGEGGIQYKRVPLDADVRIRLNVERLSYDMIAVSVPEVAEGRRIDITVGEKKS